MSDEHNEIPAEPVEEAIPPVEETGMRAETVGAPPAAPQPPVKKNNRTIWIIVIVVLILLCCCCLVIIGLIVYGVFPIQGMRYWNLLPNPGYFM
ncbi:MAG: hypothetical protein ROW39_04140 [Anaerolineaceae bacterium]